MRSILYVLVPALLLGCGGGGASGGAPEETAGCGPYPDEASSPYSLPYEVGTSSFVSQANCTDGSHKTGIPDQYAYDFLMPIGTLITASRPGTVTRFYDGYADNTGVPGEENVVGITHTDGSVALYFHLAQDGALVELQQTVGTGEVIALSGNSGNSLEPHLHVQVQDTSASINHHHRGDGDSIPFRLSDITHIRDGAGTTEQLSLLRRNDRVRTD